MNIYKKMFAYVPEMKFYLVLAVLLSCGSAVLTFGGFYQLFQILVSVLVRHDFITTQKLALTTFILLLMGSLVYIGALTFSHLYAFRLETNLRKKGIEGLAKASFQFFDVNESGVIRKTIDDNASMTHMAVAHLIPDLGHALFAPVLLFVLAFCVSLRVGIAITAITIIGGWILYKMMCGETTFIQQYQDAIKELSGDTVEYVRGIPVIKIFTVDIKTFRRLYSTIQKYATQAYAYSKSCQIPYTTYQWLFMGAVPLIMIPLAFFVEKISNPNFLFVELMMIVFLLGQILVIYMRIMYVSQHMFNANYAVTNLESLYDQMQKNKLQYGTIDQVTDHHITFENVSFSYGKHQVLQNFNLKLESGKSYALVGSSGSGKSTIAKLLSGFYKVDEGHIKIGDHPLEEYSEKAVTKAISFVFQDPKLFKVSIYDNVALAKKNASREEVLLALKLAGCQEILEKFPQKENTLIGAKGVHLSGGEKQRVSIARAILKNSPILIMDEASAAIDADAEYKLQMALQNLMHNRTVIMIAHRLTSIEKVDEILVLHKGQVIERGSHTQLMANGKAYKNLVNLYHQTNQWRLS